MDWVHCDRIAGGVNYDTVQGMAIKKWYGAGVGWVATKPPSYRKYVAIVKYPLNHNLYHMVFKFKS